MKSKISLLGIFVSLALVSVAYTNCSDVGFSDTETGNKPQGEDPTDPPPVGEVIVNCENAASTGKLLTFEQKLAFDDTKIESGRSNVCVFKSGAESDETPDANGNYTMKNNFLRSRYEQIRPMDLPSGAVVCSAKIEAPQQSFRYDDMFFFTFNDYILASSLKRSFVDRSGYGYETLNVSGQNLKFYKYDWSKLGNASFEGVNETANDYCAGQEGGFGNCAWPISEQSGKIVLEYDPAVVVPIGLKAEGTKRFGFAITGDNDPSLDCYHQNLNLTVTVSYYLKK